MSQREFLCKIYTDQGKAVHFISCPPLVKPRTAVFTWITLHVSTCVFLTYSFQLLPQTQSAWNRVLLTKLDPLSLLPLFIVYPVSKLQLHLSFHFPMAHSSYPLFVHILKAILATRSLIFQAEMTSLYSSSIFLSMALTWHFLNIFDMQLWFCTHSKQVLCYVTSF